MKRMTFLGAILAAAALAPPALTAGQQPAGQMDMQHMSHMPGMEHMAMKKAQGVKLEVKNDEAHHILTLRLGPLNLPARAGMSVAQAPDLYWTVPIEGWLVAYHPRLEDAAERTLPGRLLHHVAVYDTNRADFLCPRHPEHIFGAGGEMGDWPATPGVGYRVHPGDRILVSTMFHNDYPVSYPHTFLEVKIEYQPLVPGGPELADVYPSWFDVKECGESGYDLRPGRNVTSGEFTLGFSGKLIGVGGHLHNYGQELMLEDATRHQEVATMHARLDAQGRIISIPIVRFTESGGFPLAKGDVLKVTAIYNNPTGKYLPDSAMGIVVGYFLPDQDSAFAALRRPKGASGQ